MGVFVLEVSSPSDWIRRPIADRLAQASGIALESSGIRMRLPVDAENAVRSALDGQALDGLETASEAGPVDQLMLVKVASDADLVDLAVSEEIRHYPDHEGSTNPTGMWQRA